MFPFLLALLFILNINSCVFHVNFCCCLSMKDILLISIQMFFLQRTLSTLRPLVLMQKKISRAMSYKPRCEHSAPLLRLFNFFSIYNINLYMCGLFTFKKLIAESEWFTTYLPNEYNTRLSNMSALILPNLMTSHTRLSVW